MIESTIQIDDPVVHRGVVVAPLFPRRRPRAAYVTSEEAIPLGFEVAEVSEAGSVPELLARNPLDSDVLLYDGEELLGAKQNRILSVTVLVAAHAETKIPVTCVEQGRWSYRSRTFSLAPNHAYADLRRAKAQRLAAAPHEPGIAQTEVWLQVRAKAERLGVHSSTGAQRDIFAARESELAELRRAFPAVPGQAGALLALGDRLCLDYLSRPDAFARLYPKLLDGYLLDALEQLDRPATPPAQLDAFLAASGKATSATSPSAGRGEDIRLHGPGLVGSGLRLEDELLQLCAFSHDGDDPRPAPIARPSRRG